MPVNRLIPVFAYTFQENVELYFFNPIAHKLSHSQNFPIFGHKNHNSVLRDLAKKNVAGYPPFFFFVPVFTNPFLRMEQIFFVVRQTSVNFFRSVDDRFNAERNKTVQFDTKSVRLNRPSS